MLPATSDGLEVVERCAAERIAAGVTGCASPVEVLRAARAGARSVVVAMGVGGATAAEAMDAVRRIVASLRSYGYATEVLVAGVSSPGELVDAAIAGAHAAVVPPAVLAELARGMSDAGFTKALAAGQRAGR
jgi:transaldolase